MVTVALRPANHRDVEFFFILHKHALGPYVERVWGWDDDIQRDYLERTLDIDATQVIVVDGIDVGRLTVEHHQDHVFIGLIEIAPSHQGHGIGSRVLHALLEKGFSDGKALRLRVLEINSGAQRLFRRIGFREVGREDVTPRTRIYMQAESGQVAHNACSRRS